MKYRVDKDSTTGQALTALVQQIRTADKAGRDWLKAQGFSREIVSDTICVAGGLAGIAFDEKPQDWKLVYELGKLKYYWPIESRVSVRALVKELRALPRVRVFDYNKVIQWDGFLSRYGLAERGPYWLLDVPDARDAEPPAAPDLVEITTSEYKQLLAVPADALTSVSL